MNQRVKSMILNDSVRDIEDEDKKRQIKEDWRWEK